MRADRAHEARAPQALEGQGLQAVGPGLRSQQQVSGQGLLQHLAGVETGAGAHPAGPFTVRQAAGLIGTDAIGAFEQFSQGSARDPRELARQLAQFGVGVVSRSERPQPDDAAPVAERAGNGPVRVGGGPALEQRDERGRQELRIGLQGRDQYPTELAHHLRRTGAQDGLHRKQVAEILRVQQAHPRTAQRRLAHPVSQHGQLGTQIGTHDEQRIESVDFAQAQTETGHGRIAPLVAKIALPQAMIDIRAMAAFSQPGE